jgi:hypothetical protein
MPANQPFLLNPAGSYTVTSSAVTRINVSNQFGDPSLNPWKNYTLNGAGVSHVGLYDPGANPTAVNGEDVYNVYILVTSDTGSSPTDKFQFFVTPIQITVSNPKTSTAYIRQIAKMGATVAGPTFTFNGSAYEPTICGDGRLLVMRIGSHNFTWTEPGTNPPVTHGPQGVDIVYSYYTGGQVADPTQWTNLIPITFAPSDARINTQFGFAMAPFRDAEGSAIAPGLDIGGSYPWIDRKAKNLFFEALTDQLHYLGSDGTYDHARYPQQAVQAPNEPAPDYKDAEDAGKHQGVSFVGLWSHGKVVTIDNLNNDMDYAIGSPALPQERMVSLFQPNSGPLGNESGWLRLGYGRATRLMPPGENDNGSIIDSIQNLLNYKSLLLPISFRDVTWLMSDSKQTDELSFDDYVDPDALIVCNMSNLITFQNPVKNGTNSFFSWSGWDSVNHVFGQPVKLQNAATSTSDRWITPKNGLVLGPGRVEPAATGGVHGKGFWMDGTIGLQFTIDPQPQNVSSKNWYMGLFVDCRFANDTTDRRLLTFPDGTSVHLYGRSQVLYADATGNIVHRITIPPAITSPASPMDDLLPDIGWAHLAFQVQSTGTRVDFYLNGILFDRWDDAYQSLFQLPPGKLTLGVPSGSGVTGFTGWVDDFKVLAHTVDFETACNHAGGTLIGLPSTYTDVWNTTFASRYPAWVQTEISNRLANNGKTTYPLYANYYDYQHDNTANRFSIPAGTVSLRQDIHFPEGPLYSNAPRPDSTSNTFCTICHQAVANGGLDLGALDQDTTNTTATDPRRQPFQPPQKVYGCIPVGLVDSTNLPATAPNPNANGYYIDNWLLPGYAGNAAPQTFTLVDANTQTDLMTLTSGATVDPARLGTTKFIIRANLSTGQGSATVQIDNTSNTSSKPPYTVSPPNNLLSIGTHNLFANATVNSLAVTFNVAGNTARVVAGYRSDFRAGSPAPGWSYLWNAGGDIGNPANYQSLNWSLAPINKYTVNGFPVEPDTSSTLFPWGGLSAAGGHPGIGSSQGGTLNNGVNRFAIAAYTAKADGYYAISSSYVTSTDSRSNGGQVIVSTETSSGSGGTTTFNTISSATYLGGATLSFDENVNFLHAGDTIYIAIGPNGSDAYCTFYLDFKISFSETGNPL